MRLLDSEFASFLRDAIDIALPGIGPDVLPDDVEFIKSIGDGRDTLVRMKDGRELVVTVRPVQ